MTTFLRPDAIDVWRRVKSGTTPTGGITNTPTKLYTALPALLDNATRGVSDRLQFAMPTGEQVEQTDLGFVDGLMPAKFPGLNPGDSFTYEGFTYVVAPNGRAAFPDVSTFDVVVNGSDKYLVLQATRYYDVFPVMQLHLNFGRAWSLTS